MTSNSCSISHFERTVASEYGQVIYNLKHVIWRFRIYGLFCDILNFANIRATKDSAKFFQVPIFLRCPDSVKIMYDLFTF